MTDPINLDRILQNGYFKTSRAGYDPRSPSPPPLSSRVPRYRHENLENEYYRSRPRPSAHYRYRQPFVEDEVASLSREHKGLDSLKTFEEEIPSRGDVDQAHVLEDVPEYNPERRFVLVPGQESHSASTSTDQKANAHVQSKGKEKDDEKRFVLVSNPNETSGEQKSGSEHKHTGRQDKQADSVSSPKLVIDDQPNETLATESTVPGSRRKSTHDLPPLETHLPVGSTLSSEHNKTRESVESRSERLPIRPLKDVADSFLSLETIRRERDRTDPPYYTHSHNPSIQSTAKAHQRSHSNLPDSRWPSRDTRQDSPSPVTRKRSDSNSESRRPTRPSNLSTEVHNDNGSRPRADSSVSRKYASDSISHSRRDSTRERDHGRLNDDDGVTSTVKPRHRRPSNLIHQDRDSILNSSKDHSSHGSSRPNSRPPPVPPHVEPYTNHTESKRGSARTSSAFIVTDDDRRPYSDKDHSRLAPIQSTSTDFPYIHRSSTPSATMPSSSLQRMDRNREAPKLAMDMATKTPWQDSSYGNEGGALSKTTAGPSRKSFEARTGSGISLLHVCRRTTPVAGKMDWLTLPRTDFNICPECYAGTFRNTEYGDLFMPRMPSIDTVISCDFGSKAWYRLAWLLTLQNPTPDLRLFRAVNDAMTISRNQPCPISRAAFRNWLTIKDPYTGRAVPKFTVCWQCAKSVETLLPNLTGVFVPLDVRTDAIKSVCALHFTPYRKRFGSYFDALEDASDRAMRMRGPPDVGNMALTLEKLAGVDECQEAEKVFDIKWHYMQYLPRFTVCQECFDHVVAPHIREDNVIAKNFYSEPQRLPEGTCQLYSKRMREVFSKACRKKDIKYLEARVVERLAVEADIHNKLRQVDMSYEDRVWKQEQALVLIREWERFE